MTTREVDRRPADMRCRAVVSGDKQDDVVDRCQDPIVYALWAGGTAKEDPGPDRDGNSIGYWSIYDGPHRTANNAMWGMRNLKGNRVGVQRILAHQTSDPWVDPVEGGKREENLLPPEEPDHASYTFTFLLVVKDAASTTVPDGEIIARYERIGATVTLRSEDDTDIDGDPFWEGFDAAGCSESVSSSTVGTSGLNVTIGTVAYEPGIWDDWELGSASGANIADSSNVQFPTIHALSGGAAGNRTVPRVSAKVVDPAIADARIFSTTPSGNLGTGVDLVMVANLDANRQVIFGYETGASMDGGFTAPARRVGNGFLRVDTSAGTEAVDESTAGYTLNEAGWFLAVDVTANWLLGIDLQVDRQMAFPTVEEFAGGSWAATDAGVTDIDKLVPDTAEGYDSGTTTGGVLVFKLGTLTDPVNNALHALVCAWSKAGGGPAAQPGCTMQLMEGWTSEPSSIGTERGTVPFEVTSATATEHSGTYLVLTEAQADAITDYSDLFARFTFTADSSKTILLKNLSWLLDGADAGVTVNLTPSAVTVGSQASSPVLAALAVTASPSLLTALAAVSLPALSQLDLPLSPALLSADAQAALPALSQLDVQATSAPIALTPQPVTPVIAGGQVDITAVPALMAANAQVASAVLAALALAATPAPITALPTASSPVLSSLAINANPALLSVSPQTVSAILSALAVQAAPALLNAIAQAANPIVEGGAILATPVDLTLGSQIADPVEAALAISAASVAMSVLGQVVDPIRASLAVNAIPALVALAAQAGQPSLSALSLQLTPVTVDVNGQILNALLANLLVQATPAVIAANGQVADATFAVLAIQAIPSVLIVAAQLLVPPPIPGLATHFRRTSITQQGLQTSVTSPGHVVIIDRGS